MSRRHHITITGAFIEVLFILMLLVGLFISLVGGSSAYEAYSSQSWPTTKGEIVASRIEIFGDASGGRSYSSYVRYEYAIDRRGNDGELLVGERIGPDQAQRHGRLSAAEAELERYLKGEMVDVYYNPNRPQKSMLEPAFDPSKTIYPLIGLLVLVSALLLRVYGVRNDSKRR